MSTLSIGLLSVVMLLAVTSGRAAAQTPGVPNQNNLYLATTWCDLQGNVPQAPCQPTRMVGSVRYYFAVTTRQPLLTVEIYVSPRPCCPGLICLPSVSLPYSIPIFPCRARQSNQSVDICGPIVPLFRGVAAPIGATGGAYCWENVVGPPRPLGVVASAQAVIYDPSVPRGFVLTNAIEIHL